MKCNSKTVNTEAISNRAPTVEIARLEQDYPTWALIVWLTASGFWHSLEVKEFFPNLWPLASGGPWLDYQKRLWLEPENAQTWYHIPAGVPSCLTGYPHRAQHSWSAHWLMILRAYFFRWPNPGLFFIIFDFSYKSSSQLDSISERQRRRQGRWPPDHHQRPEGARSRTKIFKIQCKSKKSNLNFYFLMGDIIAQWPRSYSSPSRPGIYSRRRIASGRQ